MQVHAAALLDCTQLVLVLRPVQYLQGMQRVETAPPEQQKCVRGIIPEQPDKERLQNELADDERRIHRLAYAQLLDTLAKIVLIYRKSEIPEKGR